MVIRDTFSITLSKILNRFIPISRSKILVETGHWLRISLALQLPRQSNIGHPSGETSWDFLGIVNATFSDLGIDYDLFIGEMRFTRGHKTAANAKYDIDWNKVHLLKSGKELIDLIENLPVQTSIVALPNGTYSIVSDKGTDYTISKDNLKENVDMLLAIPLGPVILKINSISIPEKQTLPWNTLNYLGWTFERGEEPTEIEGLNRFSTVSGWKAYARWMQAYLFDNQKNIHPFIQKIPHLLLDRKQASLEHWKHLADTLEIETSAKIASMFHEIAQDSIPLISELISAYEEGASYQSIRKHVADCYFNDQRTLQVFNLARKHYNDIKHRKKPWT